MYDHRKIENEIASFWEKNNIYQKVKQKNAEGKPFYFCDGPPYATGEIHPGTGWNKIIKDAVCRYWRACGFNVRAQAGYDTHGLPIEVKVEQELRIKNKSEIEKKGVGRFVEQCKQFATRYIGLMNNQFKTLGVWMELDEPYITYKDEYIDSSWKTLKMAWEKGLMHEGVYVLPYCYRCETTIANYELEYDEESDPSVYLKFKTKDNEYLIIWTTTPWTLPANMAVMVHPTFTYVKAKVDDELWIIAKERLEPVLALLGKSATVIEELSGKKLEGKRYFHPFQDSIKKDYDRRIVLSDEFVSLEEGTGLVHCAPGHGPEDFIIGRRFGIEPFCPVDERGNFTEDAGIFAGKNVRETNAAITALLKENGMLLHEERIRHRYPHCWRCKTPLIFITTKQWFITISKIKDRMVEEIEKVEWHPDFAKTRFKEFVMAAPDWCISRQRYWGIPLPIWKCTKCANTRVIGSKADLPEKCELHRPYVDEIELECECGGKMRRITDVLDVWFDSGNAVWAPLSADDVKVYGDRADVIIEGQDQIRGWFYSLLGSGIIRYGEIPYKKLLMHGFFVDEKGEKMSKSLGNFVPLENIINKYGADSFRLWSLSNPTWEELKFNWDELKEANANLIILYNLISFMEQVYNGKKDVNERLEDADIWLLSKANSTLKEFRMGFEQYELNRAVRALREFLVEDVSRFYMKVAKERLDSESGDTAIQTLYDVLLMTLKMSSIVAPFLSEHLYQKFFRKYENEESLSLLQLNTEDPSKIDKTIERHMEIAREIYSVGLTVRQKAKKGLRWPLRKLWIETTSHETTDAVNQFRKLLMALLNVKELEICDKKPDGEFAEQQFSAGKLHLDVTLDQELYEEGMINEIKRRVQALRKKKGLKPNDVILLHISTEKELQEIVSRRKKGLLTNVNATALSSKVGKQAEEYNIDGRIVRIEIKKVR